VVAEVTDTNRLIMRCKGNTVLDLSRDFLNTNGARQTVDVLVKEPEEKAEPAKSEDILEILQQPNVAGQIGLAEMFDASIGKSTVLMPFGGKTQHTPEQGSVQKFPVDGFTNTASLMTYGFDPEISKASPWLGAQYSVVEALAKLAALGADSSKARLTNQEYFERLNFDPEKWGYPLQALLGLFKAQMEFGTPAIGGKDSMSGTFKDIHVPPTLITFAVATAKTDKITSSAFKEAGNPVYLIKHTPKEDGAPNYEQLKANFASLKEQIDAGNAKASRALKSAGVIEAAALMSFGNEIGAVLNTKNPADSAIGSILVEASAPVEAENWIQIGNTSEDKTLSINGQEVSIDDAFAAWNKRYDELYPRLSKAENKDIPQTKLHERSERRVSKVKVDKPVVVLPVFPGQNCEFDTKILFERAGAEVHTIVFNNLDVENIEKSIDTLAAEIEKAQIFMLVGGFSLGDEPDGSGKFIVNVLKNKKIAKALETMRANEGLILGICNGFQALIKSGLLPYGTSLTDQESATLFHNDINRHISHIGHTRITSNLSPWLQDFNAGDIFEVALSHGEGKLMATSQMLEEWNANGQIACQYVDENGNPTMDPKWNLNGSQYAIEALTSKDGMVLGKMGHSERYEPGLMQNISGNLNQHIFENGVRFFTHK
jgi:phosphoribosylformylglycinamidine synthase